MAGESKWSAAALAMVAGLFVGAAITRYNDRKAADPSSSRQQSDTSGSRVSGKQDVVAGASARAPIPPRPEVLDGSIRPETGTDLTTLMADDGDSGQISETPHSRPIWFTSAAAFDPLTPEVLKARVIELFPIGYLTLMAIIQGAAFALLFTSVAPQLTPLVWSAHIALVLTQAFATALTIVIVTQEYLLLTVAVRWVPTVFDTLIPYLLGFGEIWMALSTGHSASWWIGLSSLCAGAVLAFSYTKIRYTERGLTKESHDQHQRTVMIQSVLSIIMLMPGVALAVLNYFHLCPISLNIALTIGVTIVGVFILALGEHDQNELYDEFTLPRWRPLRGPNLH